MYVTPLEDGARAAAEVGDFWQRVLGAHTVPIPAETHDALLAWTSHLPQAIASALAVALGEHTPRGASVGSGARSTTRLAASGVAMWTDILLLNRTSVLEALEAFGATTDALRRALETENAAELTRWLEAGRAWRAQFDD